VEFNKASSGGLCQVNRINLSELKSNKSLIDMHNRAPEHERFPVHVSARPVSRISAVRLWRSVFPVSVISYHQRDQSALQDA